MADKPVPSEPAEQPETPAQPTPDPYVADTAAKPVEETAAPTPAAQAAAPPPGGPPPGYYAYGPPPGPPPPGYAYRQVYAGRNNDAWGRLRPVQIVVAGVVGAVLGAGAVGLATWDHHDDGPAHVRHYHDYEGGGDGRYRGPHPVEVPEDLPDKPTK